MSDTIESLKKELQFSKLANLELLQHSRRLAEHLRTQMDILLEVVRSSTELYTEHVRFMGQVVEQQQGREDEENQNSPAEEV